MSIWGEGEKGGKGGELNSELRGGPIDIACPALAGERRHIQLARAE
jgi:hypothetical protein